MLRVVTYNVRSLRDGADAVARVLFGLDPDVVCLQEAPQFHSWRQSLERLARQSGLSYVAGGRPTAGSALLAGPRVSIEARREVLFAKSPDLHQRGVTLTRLRLDRGAGVTVASTHLGLDAAERIRHLRELLEAVESVPSPVSVIGGDFNEGPAGPVWRHLAEQWGADTCVGSGELTFPAPRPRTRIDGIFVRGDVVVDCCRVVDYPDVLVASDHRPVVTELGSRA
jgi:endonuclease/exonuclease/phosphatase family metal-dependent hydrolase